MVKLKKIKKKVKIKPKQKSVGPKVIVTKGKKKTAIARIRIKQGKGILKINNKSIDSIQPAFLRKVILEPITIARSVLGENFDSNLDIKANINGGGVSGQAYACRTALGKALYKWTENDDLKKAFLDYDRSLLIDDVRRKEPKKYLRKGARAKPIKSYR